jgi:hypothetical protein
MSGKPDCCDERTLRPGGTPTRSGLAAGAFGRPSESVPRNGSRPRSNSQSSASATIPVRTENIVSRPDSAAKAVGGPGGRLAGRRGVADRFPYRRQMGGGEALFLAGRRRSLCPAWRQAFPCTLACLRHADVAMVQSADLGDAHCPDGEQELPGLEDEVHGGPDAAVATSIAAGLADRLSSA